MFTGLLSLATAIPLAADVSDHLSRILFAQLGSIGCWTETCRIHRICDLCTRLQPGFDLSATLIPAAPNYQSQSSMRG